MNVEDDSEHLTCDICQRPVKYYELCYHGPNKCYKHVTNLSGQTPENGVNSDMIKQIAYDIRQKIKHIPETIVHVDGEYSLVVKSYIHKTPIVIRNPQREIPCNNVVEALELIEVLKKKHLEVDD